MKVALLQTDIAWTNEALNIAEVAQMMRQNPDCDLYVLPEMWATGFVIDPREIVPNESECGALRWMQQTAAARGCAICGSLAVRLADGTFRNRHYFVDGKANTICHYDKHHLFTHGGESRFYTSGNSHTIVNYQGFRIRLQTCYDLRFPCWMRYSDQHPYDVIVVVANWPQSRQAAWEVLTAARAIENQCYLVAVNRVGNDVFTHYVGGSRVIDPIGRVVSTCGTQAEARIVELSMTELLHRREKFRVLDDRD